MILVREVFIAKPGMASKLAKMFKETWEGARIMTDMSGVYNKVVVETEYKNMAEFEKEMEEYMQGRHDETKKKSGPSHVDMYTQGKREFFRIW